MYPFQRIPATALSAVVFASGLFFTAAAQSDPVVGSADVATADPVVPPPPSASCSVTLFEDVEFANFDAKPFAYAPPDDCPGPWQKIVLSADYSVTAGRQFDRTAEIWLGGAAIYFGTTQEPSATNAPSWHIERDVTDYGALFASAHDGQARLDNFVGTSNGVDYTGILHGTATLTFYPRVPTLADHPARPAAVLPLSASAAGSTADLNGDQQLSVTFDALPTNIDQVFLDVWAQSQAGDEFWYTCVPDDLADALYSCGGTAFREAEVFVDDQPAGVAPIFPWVYTGGLDPYLWRPIPGVQTLSFEPYRVDLTPFAGLLDDGASHTVAIGVFNAQDHFSTTANLLLYTDPGATQLSGSVTTNTLTGAPSPQLQESSSDTGANISVTSNRQFTIAGTLQTAKGPVTTQIVQSITFSNVQTFTLSDTVYHQNIVQGTTLDSTTTTTRGKTVAIVHEQRSYPFTVDYDQEPAGDNYTVASKVDQEFKQSISVGNQGFVARSASRDNHVVTTDTLDFDGDFNLTGHHGQGATQTYTYQAANDTCYSRQITAAAGVLTQVADGAACPGGHDFLSWFDSFENYASAVAGHTVEMLP